jgi:serine/threonine-protein kinase
LSRFRGATAGARGAAAQAYAAGQAELRLADELPPAWRPIVADCLAPSHEQRSAHSAAALLARIQALGADRGEPGPARRPVRRSASRRVRRRVAAGALAVVTASTAAVAVAMRDSTPAPPLRTAPVTVYNVERACQHSMRLVCRLGLAGDPHAPYKPFNIVAHARHGDRLAAECFIPDGTRVAAEDLRASSRWYKVRTARGTAWLTAVRSWPGRPVAVGRCD